jgi:hypothetical protein
MFFSYSIKYMKVEYYSNEARITLINWNIIVIINTNIILLNLEYSFCELEHFSHESIISFL